MIVIMVFVPIYLNKIRFTAHLKIRIEYLEGKNHFYIGEETLDERSKILPKSSQLEIDDASE